MKKTQGHFTDIFNQWQSLCMIEVLLKLLDEELKYREGRQANPAISSQNIPIFQALHQHWEHKNLNLIQRGWVERIGKSLEHITQYTIFGESNKNNSSSTNNGNTFRNTF
jgi:hypothetical protein